MAKFLEAQETLEEALPRLRTRHLSANNRRDQTALDVPACLWLCRKIEEEGALRVLELGSGFSSWALRTWQMRHKAVTIWTIDDEPAWLEVTRSELRELGVRLDAIFTLDTFKAFARRHVYDLVFVDLDSPATRVAHVPWIVRWTQPGGVIVLDDWHMSHYRGPMTAALAEYGITAEAVPETTDRWGRHMAWGRKPKWNMRVPA